MAGQDLAGEHVAALHKTDARDLALSYARRGLAVFPCVPAGPKRKRPLIERGCRAAICDGEAIRRWWRRWPDALIGMATGRCSAAVVLDVDVKNPAANGFDTLADLGFAILPETRITHTPSGGLHLWFEPPMAELRNTGGARGRGIGPGLDWRGDGGYVIIPSPGSDYSFDPIWGIETPLAPIPNALLPRPEERCASGALVRPAAGLSHYAEAALDSACRRIIAAPAGEQEATLNAESFAIGTLAGAGAIPADFARRALAWAARQIPDYDPRRRWRAAELERKVERAFTDGMRHPREAARAA